MVRDGEILYTYRDLWRHSGLAAQYLQNVGVRSGDRVLLRLSNGWLFVVWLLGYFVPVRRLFPPTIVHSPGAVPLAALVEPCLTVADGDNMDIGTGPVALILD